MKMKEALRTMNERPRYMVSFERRERGLLVSDHFPDKHAGEKLIETEEAAWDLARKFADCMEGKAVNVYVVDASFTPVKGYIEKALLRYPTSGWIKQRYVVTPPEQVK